MAQADRQPASKRVYLEVVTTALRKLGLSEESITRSIFRGLGDGSIPYDYTGEAPPPGFWRDLDSVRFNASDIRNMVVSPASTGVVGMEWFTLRDVRLAWGAVVLKYPALRDTEPPELGTSRVEVSLVAPLMRWFETLVTRLRRKPPPPSMVQSKEPTGWQAERVLRVMRTRLYPPNGRAPRSKELKQLEGEIGAVLALEEEGKPRPKSAPSPEVVSAVVAFLGRRDG